MLLIDAVSLILTVLTQHLVESYTQLGEKLLSKKQTYEVAGMTPVYTRCLKKVSDDTTHHFPEASLCGPQAGGIQAAKW